MITALLCSAIAVAGQSGGQTVTLARINKANEKLAYEVRSHAQIEVRGEGLETWLPFDYDFSYNFTTLVKQVKADGIADMHYLRPTVTEVEGENGDNPAKEKVNKVNMDYLLTVSPLNEIVAVKDLAPPKTPKTNNPDTGDDEVRTFWLKRGDELQGHLGGFLDQFIDEIYYLAMNVGSPNSALDFSPKLPLDDVKAGDTWKRTVGYSPQRLKGKGEKSAVQRLDYTYTYKGIVDSGDRKVYRVTADLDLNTDLAEFVHQVLHATSEDTGLKSMKLTLKSHIDFDLDLQTKQTLRAEANSEGGFSVIGTEHPDVAIGEQRIKGKTVLRLVGRA